MLGKLEIDAEDEAVLSPQWVKDRLQEQPAIVIGDECPEQSHQISDGETTGPNGKVGPMASVKSQGHVEKARIEHERGRQIDPAAHADEYGNQGAHNQQD